MKETINYFLGSARFDIMLSKFYSSGKNMLFGWPQTGQRQLAGSLSNGVPGGMPFLGSPVAGS